MKNIFKKIASLLLILVLIFTMSGCDMDAQTAQNLTEGILDILLSSDEGTPVETTQAERTQNSDVSLPDATAPPADDDASASDDNDAIAVVENGWYDDVASVTTYLVRFGRLPDNYLTKREAQDLGWESSKGNLWQVAPGMSIGGDHFGNYEGNLPKGSYQEADIEYAGGSRNAKRLVFTVKGDLYIYYTDDHYNTFTQVYPED